MKTRKDIIICRGHYDSQKPTALTILTDILQQNKEVVVLHISEYLYEDWKPTFLDLRIMAKSHGVQVLFKLKSKKDCDKTVEERKKPSNGKIPTALINAELRRHTER